jgi:hypothetical protein
MFGWERMVGLVQLCCFMIDYLISPEGYSDFSFLLRLDSMLLEQGELLEEEKSGL